MIKTESRPASPMEWTWARPPAICLSGGVGEAADSQEYLRDFQTLGFPSKILIGLWYAPVITTDLGSYNVV